jgi:hypothetical protein
VNTNAVVANPNQLHPTSFYIYLNTASSGVETVLYEFLEHRGRTFHYLASSNLADQFWW